MRYETMLPINKTYFLFTVSDGQMGVVPLDGGRPIDRRFHGHGENDGFVLYEYIIKQVISFCKYKHQRYEKKCQIK